MKIADSHIAAIVTLLSCGQFHSPEHNFEKRQVDPFIESINKKIEKQRLIDEANRIEKAKLKRLKKG